MLKIPFGRLNSLLGILNACRLLALGRRTAAVIDRQSFDVVLVHSCQVMEAPPLLRWLRTPSLYYCQELHGRLYEPRVPRPGARRARLRGALDRVDPFRATCRSLLRRMDRVSIRSATRVASNSHFMRPQILSAYGRTADVCYPGVDCETFRPSGIPRERFVLSVGALTPPKGFDFVIRALGTVASADVDRLEALLKLSARDKRKE
jgi:glycosyltransferase involved in cell wall biosynthesis